MRPWTCWVEVERVAIGLRREGGLRLVGDGRAELAVFADVIALFVTVRITRVGRRHFVLSAQTKTRRRSEEAQAKPGAG